MKIRPRRAQTGNTKKIAEAIHSELASCGHEVALESVRGLKPKDLAGPVKKFLEKMETASGARLAGFVTHSTYTPEGGERQRKLHEQWAGKCAGSFEQACAAKGLVWSGYFGCQGKPSKPIEILIRRAVIKDPAEWPARIAETKQHPDAQDETRAQSRRADRVTTHSNEAIASRGRCREPAGRKMTRRLMA